MKIYEIYRRNIYEKFSRPSVSRSAGVTEVCVSGERKFHKFRSAYVLR